MAGDRREVLLEQVSGARLPRSWPRQLDLTAGAGIRRHTRMKLLFG